MTTQVNGFVAPGFEEVRVEFERNFAERGEIGAAVATYWRGQKVTFADPDARVGYAYVMNKMDFYLTDDPREKPLREAVYRAIRRLGVRPRAVDSSGAPNLSGAALASPL